MKLYRMIFSVTVLLLFSLIGVSNATPTLDVRGGNLFGASNVEVNGILYDVAFLDGTLEELYDGADQNSDFVFSSPGTQIAANHLARAACEALIDQVFIGVFDASPVLTNGIFDRAPLASAYIVTPFWVLNPDSIAIHSVVNLPGSIDDVITTGPSTRVFDSGWWGKNPAVGEGADNVVIAVWSLATEIGAPTTPVPEPTSVLLFSFGLSGLVYVCRKKNQNA